ncbi:MAG: hypothetical protein ACKVQB_00985 [Bacteroidia bacterium]
MKQVFFIIILSLTFDSCTIRFDRVPKKTLTEFPKEMCGKYFFKNSQDKDSTYLEITTNSILFSENKSLRGGTLSDSIKLAKGKKYYYLCLGDSLKNKFVWDVYPMTISGKKLYLYALDADYYKKSIKKYFTPIGGFDELYMMNEEKLDRFCHKKLKGKNALKLTRVE